MSDEERGIETNLGKGGAEPLSAEEFVERHGPAMPESVTDRCTKAHEYIFLLSKSAKYFYDADAIKEPLVEYEKKRRLKEQEKGLTTVYKISSDNKTGQANQSKTGAVRNTKRRGELALKGMKNKRSVWTISTQPFKDAHFATFPEKLIEPCILAGSRIGDTVLDPFGGSGTTAAVALKHKRKAVICELNPEYVEIAKKRIADSQEKEKAEIEKLLK